MTVPNSDDEAPGRRDASRGPRTRGWHRLLLPGLLCGVLLLCQLNDCPSTISHNATYISLATALSRGLGFVDIAEPGNPPHFNYPFLLPALLAPPRYCFPDHLLPMKLVTVLGALATVLLVPVCLGERGGKASALWASLLLAVNPLFLVAGVTVDTTAVFAAFSLLAIRAVRAYRRESRTFCFALFQAWLWLSAVYFVRTIGMVLLLATGAYLLHHRCWRKAAVLGLVVGLGVGAWWVRSNVAASERGVPGFFHIREILHAEALSGQAAYEPSNYADWLTVRKGIDRVVSNCRFYWEAVPRVLFPGYFVHAGRISEDVMPFFMREAVSDRLAPLAGSPVCRFVVCGVLMATLVAGIVARLRAGLRLEEAYVLTFMLLFLVWPHRHEQPLLLILPILLVQMCHGARAIVASLRRLVASRAMRVLPSAIALAFLAVNVATPVRLSIANLVWHLAPPPTRQARLSAMYPPFWAAQFSAAEYLRDRTPTSSRVMWATNNADVYSLWSGRKTSELPKLADADAALATVREAADYVVGVAGHRTLNTVLRAERSSRVRFLRLVHRVQVDDIDVHIYLNAARAGDDLPGTQGRVSG